MERGTYTTADLVRRLREYEAEYEMPSDVFFGQYERGELPHLDAFFVWAGLCGYLGIEPRSP